MCRVKNTKAVIISRLASMKNLIHAVKAFSLVVKEIPEAKLDIFGSGEDFEKIKKKLKIPNCRTMSFERLYG